jgi:hypothetical protein
MGHGALAGTAYVSHVPGHGRLCGTSRTGRLAAYRLWVKESEDSGYSRYSSPFTMQLPRAVFNIWEDVTVFEFSERVRYIYF